MKILDDILSSITGNAKTRINDPFIGTFICSWIICNWYYLSLLFLGEGKTTDRVIDFYKYLSGTPVWQWNYVFTIPFSITIFYLFIFPWGSLLVNFIQHWADEKLHAQAVDVELVRITKQQNLNKEKLKSNPNKHFLEQLVQQEIDKRNEILGHIKLRATRLESKALEAKEKYKEQEAKAKESESNAHLLILDLEKRTNQAEIERIRFESNSAKARSTRASHRFPSVYYLMLKIDESLNDDNIKTSLRSLGNIVAALFGYENFDALINDENFNNETLAKVEFVYYDDELAKRLEKIVLDENSDNEDFTADMIFSHLEMLFDDIPLELITDDSLAERCRGKFESNPYDILHCEGTAGAIAESDTQFEEIDDINIVHFDFDNGFYTELSAVATGYHYRDSDVPGRVMTVTIKMQCDVLLGKYGLGTIEQREVNGTMDDYD